MTRDRDDRLGYSNRADSVREEAAIIHVATSNIESEQPRPPPPTPTLVTSCSYNKECPPNRPAARAQLWFTTALASVERMTMARAESEQLQRFSTLVPKWSDPRTRRSALYSYVKQRNRAEGGLAEGWKGKTPRPFLSPILRSFPASSVLRPHGT